jgi:carbohydrate kinase (thermoresistant glucokinase family)
MILVVMGVSGSGKTTIGVRLAKRLGLPFVEGDRFHPPANIAKMSSGVPLDDADRRPWLEALAGELDRARRAGAGIVLVCSALRRAYRDILRAGHSDVVFVFLDGDKALIRCRLKGRRGHFMPAALLDSQFATLERPAPDERAVRVAIGGEPDAIVETVLAALASPVADNWP